MTGLSREDKLQKEAATLVPAMERAHQNRNFLSGEVPFDAVVLDELSSLDVAPRSAPLPAHEMVLFPKAHEVQRLFLASDKLNGSKKEALDVLRSIVDHVDFESEHYKDERHRAAKFYMQAKGQDPHSEELLEEACEKIQSYVNHQHALAIMEPSFLDQQVIDYTNLPSNRDLISQNPVVVTAGGDNQFLGIFHQLQTLGLHQNKIYIPFNTDFQYSRGALTSAPAVFWEICKRHLEAGAYNLVEFPLIEVCKEVRAADGPVKLEPIGNALSEVFLGANARERITKIKLEVYADQDPERRNPLVKEYQEGSGILVANTLGISGWMMDAWGKKGFTELADQGILAYPHTSDVSPKLFMYQTESAMSAHKRLIIEPGSSIRVTLLSDSASGVVLDSESTFAGAAINAGDSIVMRISQEKVKIVRFHDWMRDEDYRAFFKDHGIGVMRPAR